MGARVSSGKDSAQEVGTPRELIDAVAGRFGPITFDLAADASNHVADRWYGPGSPGGTDSLLQDWHRLFGLLWLNPPYAKIGPWSKKCVEESRKGARIAMLVPFTLAKWAAIPVFGHAAVCGLIPRVRFIGHVTDFPKDLMIAVYGPDVMPSFELWRWKERQIGRSPTAVNASPIDVTTATDPRHVAIHDTCSADNTPAR